MLKSDGGMLITRREHVFVAQVTLPKTLYWLYGIHVHVAVNGRLVDAAIFLANFSLHLIVERFDSFVDY